jgi:hypothetical protein
LDGKIKKNFIWVFIGLFLSSSFLCFPVSVEAQGTVSNLDLTFHGYSVLMSYSNGSLVAYDGVDGAPPTKTSATKVDLNSQISGEQMGFTYWSGILIWATQLPMDLYVKGNVNVRAYISSTFPLSGFFSGGGYGMGLVDIDEKTNIVQQFLTQAPYTIGGNPFSSAPSRYSLDVPVDYVFKKGHWIGFAVGLGATTQGFTASVYFDSADRNSGATLPVLDVFQAQTALFDSKMVAVTGNSVVKNIQFSSGSQTLSFLTEGIDFTPGRCTAAIPKSLMQPSFTVSQGSRSITASISENDTYYNLSFTHTRSSEPIHIVGSTSTPNPTPTPTSTSSATSHPSPTGVPTGTHSPQTPTKGPTQGGATISPTPEVPEFGVFLPLLIAAITTLLAAYLFFKRGKKEI